jgi:hypothetical protein
MSAMVSEKTILLPKNPYVEPKVLTYRCAIKDRVWNDQMDRLVFLRSYGNQQHRMWRGYVAPHNRRRKPILRGADEAI